MVSPFKTTIVGEGGASSHIIGLTIKHMYKLREEENIEELLLELIDGITESMENYSRNSGLNWRDKIIQIFFKNY